MHRFGVHWKQVPVEVWRGRLWARALAEQGVTDGGLGDKVQGDFTTARTARFKFAPKVAVRRSWPLPLLAEARPSEGKDCETSIKLVT